MINEDIEQLRFGISALFGKEGDMMLAVFDQMCTDIPESVALPYEIFIRMLMTYRKKLENIDFPSPSFSSLCMGGFTVMISYDKEKPLTERELQYATYLIYCQRNGEEPGDFEEYTRMEELVNQASTNFQRN